MINRKEKIKFLNGLISGENKIYELQPRQDLVFRLNNKTQKYECEKLKCEFTEDKLREYQKRHPQISLIIVHRKIINRSNN